MRTNFVVKCLKSMVQNQDKDKELLDKLVAKEKLQHEKLSSAIKQKISWRQKYQASAKNTVKDQQEETDVDAQIESKFKALMEERDLQELGLPEELRAEVKDLAQLKKISVKEAANLPYIKNRKEEIEREAKILNSSPKRKGSGSYVSNIDPSKPLNPDDFDLSTEKGRKKWNEAKEARQKYMESQSGQFLSTSL